MKKSSLHLKKLCICFSLLLLICFGFLSLGLKVNAADNEGRNNNVRSADDSNESFSCIFNTYSNQSLYYFINDDLLENTYSQEKYMIYGYSVKLVGYDNTYLYIRNTSNTLLANLRLNVDILLGDILFIYKEELSSYIYLSVYRFINNSWGVVSTYLLHNVVSSITFYCDYTTPVSLSKTESNFKNDIPINNIYKYYNSLEIRNDTFNLYYFKEHADFYDINNNDIFICAWTGDNNSEYQLRIGNINNVLTLYLKWEDAQQNIYNFGIGPYTKDCVITMIIEQRSQTRASGIDMYININELSASYFPNPENLSVIFSNKANYHHSDANINNFRYNFENITQSYYTQRDYSDMDPQKLGNQIAYQIYDNYLQEPFAVAEHFGYENGYLDGQRSKTALQNVWDMISGIFGVLGTFLSVELFPHVPIGLFFLVPLIFGAFGFIIWLWKRGN